MASEKPIKIPKQAVWGAWLKVKKNGGSCGIDQQTIEEIDKNPKKYLYKIWNRLSSGSYFPPSVKGVAIPKKSGGERILGIPTVLDRVAQTLMKDMLEPRLEPIFHEDSFGYRPNKSALDAVGRTRKRCWKYSWVVEFDIRGLFDNIDHDLLLKAIRHHCEEKWIVMYLTRWLKASMVSADGKIVSRNSGTPQGGVISPLLANLFMHYAFDMWLQRNYPGIPFCRYADDGILHCISKKQATFLLEKLRKRMSEVGLELHPQKTKVIFCKMEGRHSEHKRCSFEFLGYIFKPRKVRDQAGKIFLGFTPGISPTAKKSLLRTMKRWKLHFRVGDSLDDIAQAINPVITGWFNYYGKFNKSSLKDVWTKLNWRLAKWLGRKYKGLKGKKRKCIHRLGKIAKVRPQLFAHWEINYKPSAG